MARLHLLEHLQGLSDEEVCAAWLENPYFQLFCGEEHFQHRLPFDRSSMTRWRQRVGVDALEVLLAATIAVAVKAEAVSGHQLERITVDTTVQTRAIALPTDSHLRLRPIEWLLANVEGHNGRVGQWGNSYPGFYTAAGMIDAHPALAAVSPQAPVTDYFLGDDSFHNGAFMLAMAFLEVVLTEDANVHTTDVAGADVVETV